MSKTLKQNNLKNQETNSRSNRNKSRKIKHMKKLLDLFRNNLVLGYSEESWSELASLYRQISSFVSLQEIKALGNAWRNTWTEEVNPAEVDALINAIKANVEVVNSSQA